MEDGEFAGMSHSVVEEAYVELLPTYGSTKATSVRGSVRNKAQWQCARCLVSGFLTCIYMQQQRCLNNEAHRYLAIPPSTQRGIWGIYKPAIANATRRPL